MKSFIVGLCLLCATGLFNESAAQQMRSRFKALVLFENGGHHVQYTAAATKWLDRLSADSNFRIDYINNTHNITSEYLAQYQLFIQLDYPPYNWGKKAEMAFEDYISNGWGGWIGFHHATLLGQFDGFPLWQWFSNFMGGIEFRNYIPGFADGSVRVESRDHPCVKGLPENFVIENEEWYTYNSNPRGKVKVIASVDENTYRPDSPVKMGDHPVVWTNTAFPARNIYIFMGHSPKLFGNNYYTLLFRNAIFWSASK